MLLLDVEVRQLEELLVVFFWLGISEVQVLVTPDPSSELHVFLHESDSLSVDTAEVSILKHAGEVCLCRLLEGHQSLSLESEVRVDVSADVSDQSLEWSSWQEEIGRLLVSFDLSQSNSSWLELHLFSLFDTSVSWSSLLHVDLGDGLGLGGHFADLGSFGVLHRSRWDFLLDLGGGVLSFWHF